MAGFATEVSFLKEQKFRAVLDSLTEIFSDRVDY